jgi:nitrite reductase/ring-hydroxylating ferredoxin subunit
MRMSEQVERAAELFVGTRADFGDGGRRIVSAAGTEIGVLHHDGRFYAYENRCLHQGGPVCEGRILGKVEAVLDEDKAVLGERFSSNQIHLVCPWHGYEYDLTTGQSAVDPRRALRRFDVVERGDEIYVVI